MEDKIRIRTAKVSDASGIATVHVKTWQQAYRGQIPDFYLDKMSIPQKTESWKKTLEELGQSTYMYVANKDGNIVGWIIGGKSRDNDLPSAVGELGAVNVHPDYAGQGIGSQLVSTLLSRLKSEGFNKATLWVLDTNTKTISWYEKRGWKLEGKTKVDHRDGFDLHEVRYVVDL